jgi:hypothetical protein
MKIGKAAKTTAQLLTALNPAAKGRDKFIIGRQEPTINTKGIKSQHLSILQNSAQSLFSLRNPLGPVPKLPTSTPSLARALVNILDTASTSERFACYDCY